MSNRKSTKRALLGSVMAMVLCLAMLVGATFAWFTDTASTGVNKIVSGNLDVDIIGADTTTHVKELNFTKAAGATDEAILWEPGCRYVTEGFRIANNGNLALKWKVEVNKGTTAANDNYADLLDVIDFYLVTGTGENQKEQPLDVFTGNLTKGATSDVYYIKGVMQESAGNEYMGLTLDGITITVYATQDTVEYDSINNTYDENATLDFEPVSTADELKEAMEAGKNVSLTDDITLTEWVSVKDDLTIQGNGKTLTSAQNGDNERVVNLQDSTGDHTITLNNVNLAGPTSGSWTRGIAFYNNSGKVRVVMDNCSVSANYYAINVAGLNNDIEVTVKNSVVSGWCAAQTWSVDSKLTFENCTIIGTNVYDAPTSGNVYDNDFANIIVNTDAENSVLTFNNCRFEANTTGTAQQFFFILANDTATIDCTNCTFFHNGTQVSGEALDDYFNVSGAYADHITIH